MATNQHLPESENQDTPSPRPSGGGGRFFDIITAVFVLATVIMISGTILIVNNPRVSFNPLPLADLPTRFISPTPQPTFTPSITPSLTVTPFPPTITPTISLTPTLTQTPTPTVTNTQVISGIEPAASLTPIITLDNPSQPTRNALTPSPPTNNVAGTPSPYPFIAREIRYEPNTTDQGCQWLSIAGNAIGLNGEPLTDLLVEIVGENIDLAFYTGSNTLFGLSGFEIPVAFAPQALDFSIRLTEQDIPLTDYISVTTGTTCEENVVVIEFVQVRDY